MRLHSNSLFHFTNKAGLLYILKNNFVPCYCKERLAVEKINYDYWVPMVSFCDIPLSQIKSHIKEYGKYAIGLNRKWVNRNKLNPVFYYKEKTFFFDNYYKLLTSLEGKSFINNTKAKELNNYYFAFFKPYRGVDIRPEKDKEKNEKIENKKQKTKIFYDEREWRYVPKGLKENEYIILDRDYNKLNKQLNNYKLTFEPDDISYIIIEKEEERQEFVQDIWERKENYSEEKKLILITKIISSEQILNDM